MYPSMPVTAVRPTLPSADLLGPSAPGFEHGFGNRLESALERVNSVQLAADGALSKLASGGDVDLHGSMIALSEAEIALKAMVSVRDKVVSAYETLLNLAV
jgi:flagellar hook-basal body complex protein FliE